MSFQPHHLPIATGAVAASMSSREIAELTEKRHDNVVRDVKAMIVGLHGEPGDTFERLEKDPSKLRNLGKSITWEKDGRGFIVVFHLDQEHSYTLVAGYDVQMRQRIVRRWMELEVSAAPQTPDLSNPTVLLALLTEHTAKRVEAEKRVAVVEARNEVLQPKALAHDRLVATDGEFLITDAAKVIGIPRQTFIDHLFATSRLCRRASTLRARDPALKAGILVERLVPVDLPGGFRKSEKRVFVTTRGLALFTEELTGQHRYQSKLF